MKKWLQRTKKQKWVIVVVGTGVVCGGIFGAYQAYEARQQTVARQTLEKQLSVLKVDGMLTSAIADLEDSQGYLAEGLTQDTIASLQKQLEKIDETTDSYDRLYHMESIDSKMVLQEINALDIQQGNLNRVRAKFTMQGKVNGLFHGTTHAIDGAEVAKELILADRVTLQTIDDLALADQSFEEDKWFESISALVEEAKGQLKTIDQAEKAVNACYKDQKVDPKVTKKMYETAEKAVKAIKRTSDKERLDNKLAEIKKVVNANEKKAKEEAEKKKQEEAKKAAAEAANANQEATPQTESYPEESVADQAVTGGSGEPGNSGGQYQAQTPPANAGNSGGTTGGSNGSNQSTTPPSGGGSSNNGGGNSNNQQKPPTPPAPEKPYPLIPYTGSGKQYSSYSAAAADGEKWMLESPNASGGYNIFTEYWSDGSMRYYLELY